MSWKGFQKGVTRAPQNIKQKFNIGEITKDAIYVDAERRFTELEKETNKLLTESKKYFDAINSMLNHQIEFSKACAEIYKPISGRISDTDSLVTEGNPDGIRACEEYENIVRDLQSTLEPELELIQTRVIRPAVELLEVVKIIRKATTKRDHKQLDYDRRRTTLKKLQDKKEKSLKDEKALYKAENDVEQATQEYNYYNDIIKEDLPRLFALEREFVQPLFQSFYYMQLNVFYTMHEKMQSIDIGYFDLQTDIEEAFNAKRGNIQQEAENLGMVHFKTTGGRKPRYQLGAGSSKPALGAPNKPLAITAGPSSPSPSRQSISTDYSTATQHAIAAPPPYAGSGYESDEPYQPQPQSPPQQQQGHATALAAVTGAGKAGWSSAASGKAKPPPPKPKPARLGGVPPVETVTAIYDFAAQADGDLSFSAGDRIEIVSRTDNTNEWWTGRLRGAEGQFPGNYVQLG